VNDVRLRGLTYEEAALKYGVVKSTICKWMKKAPEDQKTYIDTISSRPHHHPNELRPEIVERIVSLRKQLKRCAPIIHAHLLKEHITVSLSSVARVLQREGLTRKRRVHYQVPIPPVIPDIPGGLVQADTIHYVKPDYSRFYVYAVIDTCTRLAYAEYHPKLSVQTSLHVLNHASQSFGFPFKVVQTDNGPEFSQNLYFALQRKNIPLKHSRVRKPNDNAFIERFNRTLQEECFNSRIPNQRTISQQLQDYLVYYNQQRLHLSLNCKTPTDFVSKLLK
jgi:transposase InsO family protein